MHIILLGSGMPAHINKFQEVIHYLANANFPLAEHVAIEMLLSLLPCNPGHLDFWDCFAKSMKVDTTTTLAGIASQILEDKHWQTAKSGGDSIKTILVM